MSTDFSKIKSKEFYLLLLILFLLACFSFYRPAWHAQNLDIHPDTTERVASSFNYLEQGKYQIKVDDQWHPSRYNPIFSFIYIVPALYLIGDIGSPVYLIYGTAVIGICLIYLLASKLSSPFLAFLASCIIITMPDVQKFSKHIATDLPAGIILTLFALYFIFLFKKDSRSNSDYFKLGILLTFGIALRESNIFCLPLALLLLKPRLSYLTKFFLLCFPVGIIFLITFYYNYQTFGDPLRNGYHYWTSIPYDFSELTFNLKYFFFNLDSYFRDFYFEFSLYVFVFLTLAYLVLKNIRFIPQAEVSSKSFTANLAVFFLLCLPLFIFYCLYFFQESRFIIGIKAIVTILIAVLLHLIIANKILSQSKAIFAIKILLLIFCINFTLVSHIHYSQAPQNISNAIKKYNLLVKDNSILISPFDQVTLTLRLKKKNVQLIALDRLNEYAGKTINYTKPDFVPVFDPYNHRSKEILAAGAKEAIKKVAYELVPELKANDQNIYLHLIKRSPARKALLLKFFNKHFELKEIEEDFYQLKNKARAPLPQQPETLKSPDSSPQPDIPRDQ